MLRHMYASWYLMQLSMWLLIALVSSILLGINCGTPATVNNATPTPATVTVTTYLATVQYDCNTGYEFSDATTQKTITCQADKSWDTVGHCQSMCWFLVIAKCKFHLCFPKCDLVLPFEYMLTTICWSVIHVCLVVDCGTEPTVNNAASTPPTVTVTTYLATVQYDCDTGYEFPDATMQKTITCQANKTWKTINHCQGMCW